MGTRALLRGRGVLTATTLSAWSSRTCTTRRRQRPGRAAAVLRVPGWTAGARFAAAHDAVSFRQTTAGPQMIFEMGCVPTTWRGVSMKMAKILLSSP